MKKLEYVFGHSQREIQRLIYQAAIVKPVTERLLRRVKLGSGMRVLDLGCGAGDVSMLAAQFVGPTGLVVGIDRNRDVLALAAERWTEPTLRPAALNAFRRGGRSGSAARHRFGSSLPPPRPLRSW